MQRVRERGLSDTIKRLKIKYLKTNHTLSKFLYDEIDSCRSDRKLSLLMSIMGLRAQGIPCASTCSFEGRMQGLGSVKTGCIEFVIRTGMSAVTDFSLDNVSWMISCNARSTALGVRFNALTDRAAQVPVAWL